jgi:hypothetical protein
MKGGYVKFEGDIVSTNRVCSPALMFWINDSGHAYHTALYIGYGLFIEAGGGGSATTSEEKAKRQNAYIMLNALESKPNAIFVDFLQLRRTT